MKKGFKQLILFLVLMVVLASGSSYLSLNHVTKSKNAKDVQTMAIALVNEDEGATFNNNDLSFGDAFVKSLDKNNEHDWYVVSRGVAESGLERNTYDMMVVIPNDFSEKALSISSEAPEHVVLNYKINASGNKNFQAEAEKTASSILNDFNRRIIDVYFASVIGNLQEAQDNIGEVVKEEALYTNTYNNSIHSPLANYTDQFSNVKDSAKTSKDSFSGLEDTLGTFGKQLSDDANMNQDYLSSMSDTSKLLENNSVLSMNFVKQLNQFNAGLNSGHVEEQLRNLQTANDYINSKFQERKDDTSNILSGTFALRSHLASSKEKVDSAKAVLDETLNPENPKSLKSKVEKRLNKVFGEAFNGELINMDSVFNDPDKKANQRIKQQIDKLPSLNEDDIDGLGLPVETAIELKNVIAVTKKYKNEFNYNSDQDEHLTEEIKRLKEHLNNAGLTETDIVTLPKTESEEKGQLFTLTIPSNFSLQRLTLQLNKYEIPTDSLELVDDDGVNKRYQLNLSTLGSGEFTVEVMLQLEDTSSLINVFQPATWSWELESSDDNEPDVEGFSSVQLPNTPLVASLSTGEPNKNETEENTSLGNETEGENIRPPSEENDKETNVPKEKTDQSDDLKNNNQDETDKKKESGIKGNESQEQTGSENGIENPNGDIVDGEGNENPDDKDEKPDEVEVINDNHFYHKATPIVDDTTKQLINALHNSIKQYQRMFTLYEMYFGFNMESEELRNELLGHRLSDLAAENRSSLYYLFNVENIGNLLTKYVINQVVDGVTEQIRQPLANLQGQIGKFQQQVNWANGKAEELAEDVTATKEKAAILNDNLAKTLANVTKWREQSLQLLEQQSEIQANNEEEHTAVMTLGSEFQPLLMSSQTLAEQAQTNLNSAENVYQTFDNIDEQASQIQQSGTNLVSKAGELSVNMTNNLLEDQEFADNFADVLANSRIGDRQNEDLYDFLSNPVQTKNNGTIVAGDDKFTPYFLVLVCFIVALFTAYVISTNNQRRIADDQFESEKSLMGKNTLITTITGSIGVAEGIIIGLLSGYFLHISEGELIKWTGLITLVMVVMLLVATYLLRQLKMIGMFILLVVLSLYLFLTKALGSGIAGLETLRMYSPLQHVETLISKTALGATSYGTGVFVLLGLALIGVLANLLVLYRTARKGEEDDERVAEAN
ncbi:type VII secretion protein EsaA [Virgibacillus dakarensis]|nr:type VII secretion protein EsaA [Virgibacillus dakarensis]